MRPLRCSDPELAEASANHATLGEEKSAGLTLPRFTHCSDVEAAGGLMQPEVCGMEPL